MMEHKALKDGDVMAERRKVSSDISAALLEFVLKQSGMTQERLVGWTSYIITFFCHGRSTDKCN